MRRSAVLFALIATALCAQDSREVVNRGVAAFKGGNYQQAAELFRQAVTANPNDVNAHLYLGTTYMSQWIPGNSSPDNAAFARSAETEFKRALELDPINQTALNSLAGLAYHTASSMKGEERIRRFDEAMDWYKRLAAVAPTNKEAPYSMGVIAWAKWYPALMTARAGLHMKPEDPGPLPSPAKDELKTKYSALLEEGIANLKQALLIDPQYDDAMAYLNLLIRERADLRDTKEEYLADVAVADELVHQVLAVKKMHAQFAMVPPPPPPPTQGGGGGAGSRVLRDDGNTQPQTVNPVVKVDPVYPPLARQARISGTVRFTVRIAKDGSIQNIQLVSGHPLLVAAALEAVKQYVYSPVLLNGSPVEAVTQVDINFVLTQMNN
jgi:TonB family protein